MGSLQDQVVLNQGQGGDRHRLEGGGKDPPQGNVTERITIEIIHQETTMRETMTEDMIPGTDTTEDLLRLTLHEGKIRITKNATIETCTTKIATTEIWRETGLMTEIHVTVIMTGLLTPAMEEIHIMTVDHRVHTVDRAAPIDADHR